MDKTAPRRFRQLRPEEVDELVEAYRAGATARKLGGLFGIHPKTVGKHLRARGIDTTPPGLAPEHIPTAIHLYEDQGWSLARIADRFGTTPNTVWRRLLEAGVTIRDPQGRER